MKAIYAPPAKSAWYADGLRWIGTLFHTAADHVDSTPDLSAPLEPLRRAPAFEEFLGEVRHRVHTHF